MRVLITGVSATGKSSLVHELRRRGFTAYDADDDGFTEPGPNGAWSWRVDVIQKLLDDHREDLVLFAACSDEQTHFSFDRTVLLTAPVDVVVGRLRSRTTNRMASPLVRSTVSSPRWSGYFPSCGNQPT